MIGLAWLLACLGVLLPDVGYIINTLMIALLFISPIGFRADLVPDSLRFVTALNPMYYMMESYRSVLISGFGPHWTLVAIFAAISLVTFALGAAFFRRFKGILVDYE
jgi:lipopolysaccharide transport system permease protein